MAELHQATVEWSGDRTLATVFLAAASRPNCSAQITESDEQAHLTVVVEHESLQELRDIVDRLLVAFADIEGE